MSPWVVAAAILLTALAVAVTGWRLAGAAGARYRELLEAVLLTQRQLTELRSRQDEVRALLERTEGRLAREVAPVLARLERRALLLETAGEVARAEEEGTLEAPVSRALLEHLAELRQENAAAGRPY